MTNKDYVAKINNATPMGLTILTYELLISNLKKSINLIENNIVKKEDLKVYEGYINKSKSFLDELVLALDLNLEMSKNILEIYLYINKEILISKITFDKLKLELSLELLNELMLAFIQVEKITNKNNEGYNLDKKDKIFAGLTYTKNKLDEYIEEKGNREYKV